MKRRLVVSGIRFQVWVAHGRDYGPFTLEPLHSEVALSLVQAVALGVDDGDGLYVYRSRSQEVKCYRAPEGEYSCVSVLAPRLLVDECLMERVMVLPAELVGRMTLRDEKGSDQRSMIEQMSAKRVIERLVREAGLVIEPMDRNQGNVLEGRR